MNKIVSIMLFIPFVTQVAFSQSDLSPILKRDSSSLRFAPESLMTSEDSARFMKRKMSNYSRNQKLIVNTKSLNIRSGGRTEFEIVGTIAQGEELVLLDKESNVKSYILNDTVVEVLAEDIDEFLVKFPNAVKIRTFLLGNDLYEIPIAEVDEFVADNPEARDKNGWWHVSYKGIDGYVLAQHLVQGDKQEYRPRAKVNPGKIDPYKDWERKTYISGQTPECENIVPQYDFSINNYLKITVGSHTDVVLKLMKQDYYRDLCIRIVYVRSNESYIIKNIPEGNYYLKLAYGSDWRQKISDNKCYGKFTQYNRKIEMSIFQKSKCPFFSTFALHYSKSKGTGKWSYPFNRIA